MLYRLSKVRGHKVVVTFFPHEAAQLEPVVALLLRECGAPSAQSRWTTPFALLLWLSILVLIPFDLRTVDSGGGGDAVAHGQDGERSLVRRLICAGQAFLSDPGPSRDMSAFMLSRLFSRRDAHGALLSAHLRWCVEQLQQSAASTSAFLAPGLLRSLVDVCKYGNRDALLLHLPVLAPFFLSHPPPFAASSSVLTRKLSVKLVQRLALLYLKPRTPSWRYQRGSRSLLENLRALHGAAAASTPLTAAAPSARCVVEDDEQEYDEVPSELEAIVQRLLDGLSDSDTVVRWSCAKGIGRVTMALSSADADDVVCGVLDVFERSAANDDAAWHGACLAVAELARRGLLLPGRLSAAMPWTLRALHFDVRSAAHSVGAHVRDAACYVVWAFARAYEAEVMRPFARALAEGLLLLAVYDREVNVRRAACAAFQENVGRHAGAQAAFPHGIELITVADYFTVANLTAAYTAVGRRVAAFPAYTRPVLEHLATVKVRHWDREVRELACRAVADLAELSDDVRGVLRSSVLPALYGGCSSDDLCERHGCTLAIAALTIALHTHGAPLSAAEQQQLLSTLLSMHERQLFSTRRSPLLRLSLSRLLVAASLLPAPLPSFTVLLSLLEENLQHLEDDVQRSAVEAAACYWQRPEMTDELRSATLQRWMRESHSSALLGARRGFTLALASLSVSLLVGATRADIARVLGDGVRRTVQADAEARRNSVLALSTLCSALGAAVCEALQPPSSAAVSASPQRLCDVALRAFVEGLDDYATDNRGDVGSWVREAAMKAIERLALQVAALQRLEEDGALSEGRGFPAAAIREVVCALLKQAVEKIDRVRECAAHCLCGLVGDAAVLQHAPHAAKLRSALSPAAPSTVDWSAPSASFPRLVPLLALPTFTLPLLCGLVVSVGGLTESVVRHSSAALVDYLRAAAPEAVERFADALLSVLLLHRGQARVVVPALKTADILLSQSLLDALPVRSPFPAALCERCERESATTANVSKLLHIAAVQSGLLALVLGGADGPAQTASAVVRHRALAHLLSLLAHAYPKVRRVAAEALYGALLAHSEEEGLMRDLLGDDDGWSERLEDAQAILSDTAWDGAALAARAKLRTLRQLLNMPGSEHTGAGTNTATAGAGHRSTAEQVDEEGSTEKQHKGALRDDYTALVNAAGY